MTNLFANRIVGYTTKHASQLTANPANWRKHPQRQRDAVQASLKELGWIAAVVENVRTGYLVDGHERVWQALRDNDAEVPVLEVDLSEAEERLALATFDPITYMAETDAAALDALLRDVNTGEAALQELMAQMTEDAGLYQPKEAVDAEPQIDRAEELRVKWDVKSGDLWQLGDHRLVCGDCTDAAVVARVMGGERAQACVTDPPYGVELQYGQYEDSESNLADLASRFLPLARELCEVVGLTPGNGNQKHYPYSDWTLGWFFASGMNRVSWEFQNWQPVLVWGKDPYLARGMGARPDAFWISEKMEESAHPCAKPLETWTWIVQRLSPEKGAIVYEPFSGSGTTIIACEQLGRKCRAIEIAPGYVAVALQRWTDATGKTPGRVP